MRYALLAVIVSLLGCGPSLRTDTTEQPKAAEATGRHSVAAIEGPTAPLIVDWNPEQRGDLEEAIQDGVAVVAYDKKGMRLLKRCKVAGDYGYIGMTTKTQVVRLESAEDVALNLPLSGASIAGNIGAELAQGATLDIALVMVGKKRTTWNEVTRKDLEGKCDGATHYVRGITVGAFAMGTGTKQKARAAAEIFGIGASAGASNSSKVNNTDGKLSDCDKADPESEKPPSQCAALLRVELEPIAKEASEPKPEKPEAQGEKKPEVAAAERIDCGPGKVFLEGKCTTPKKDAAYVCKSDDPNECKTQCDKGNAQSCDHYGVLVSMGKAPGVDKKDALAVFDKGCQGGSASACANLGIRLLGTDRDKAMSKLEQACREGLARGCAMVAFHYRHGRDRDDVKAVKYYVAGCNGGDHQACVSAALMFSGGSKSVPKDEKKALMLNMRACNGGVGTACANAGEMHELAMGTPKDMNEAARLYERGCNLSPASCWGIAILSQVGGGRVPRSDVRAKELYTRTCRGGFGGVQNMACFLLSALYKEPEPRQVNKASFLSSMQTMQPLCDNGMVRACVFAGVMQLASGDKVRGQMTIRKACGSRDAWACDLAKRLAIP